MKKYYIPTSSLNFNNILSSESISPKSFYSARSFGYSRWTSIPENPFDNSIVLYDKLCALSRPLSDYEDHPMIVEVYLDESVASTLVPIAEHVFLCDHSIYVDPFSSSIFFFTESDRRIALSMSDASIETKLVQLFRKKISVINLPSEHFPVIDSSSEVQNLNVVEIEKDKRINRMKGLLYGYYIGSILSPSFDDLSKLNDAREIYNILAAILASFDHKATELQRERLKALYAKFQPPVPFFSKLSSIVNEKSLFDAIVSLVRGEYGYIKGEFDVDRTISQLLTAATTPDSKNPVVENCNSIIKQIESSMLHNARSLSVEDSQIVVIDGALVHLNINGVSEQDKKLCIGWLNDVLSKDEFNGKVSTFKEALSDEITRKAKDLCENEWKGSYPEITLNALRRHVRGDEFPHEWKNDIYSSIAAVVVRGDDWQKLLQYVQSKEMTDYRLVFAFYGTLNGFANLPRDFTDLLFGRESKYIAEVYKEFYGQLFGRSVLVPAKNTDLVEQPIQTIDGDMPDFEKENKSSEPLNPIHLESSADFSRQKNEKTETIVDFDSLMSDIVKKCPGAKKDEKRYLEFYARYGEVNQEFINDVCDEKVFGKKIQLGVRQVLFKKLKPQRNNKPLPERDNHVSDSADNLFSNMYPSTGTFLSDVDFLINNPEFAALMSGMNKKWIEDLTWFIEAHDPNSKDYSYYKGKPIDNATIIRQFVDFKKGKYRITESFLRRIYK